MLPVAVVIGEYFNEWNTSHNRYERTTVTNLGVELFCITMLMYAVWWLYFDNMNLAIADNDHHHLLLAWLHLNLLMCVNESEPPANVLGHVYRYIHTYIPLFSILGREDVGPVRIMFA